MTVLKEAGTLSETAGGRFKIGVITPGIGSSGTYPRETIEAAGRDKVFAAGTHMYLDHATESEAFQRPEGSIRDLVGVLAEDAYWDDAAGGLVAEARIYSNWRPVLAEMKDDIGISIRASGEVREDAGKRVVTRLAEARSVDFVTHAGRGGRILEVIESARQAEQQEGVSDETRQLLQRAVRDAHSDRWVWVRDHTDSTVWFDIESDAGDTTYEQPYTRNGVEVALTGEAVEVFPTTTYVPVNKTSPEPTGADEVSNTEEAAVMATTQIEEAQYTELVERAGRAEQLETELAEAKATIEQMEADKAAAARREAVSAVVEEAFGDVQAPVTKEDLVTRLAESDLDDEAVAAKAKAVADEIRGVSGQVRGLGESAPVGTGQKEPAKSYTDEDVINVLEGA